MTDPTPMRLLERCHAALCERLAELQSRRDCTRRERAELLRSGSLVLDLATEMDEGPAFELTRQLIRDLERQMGKRPQGIDAWMAELIDGGRRAA